MCPFPICRVILVDTNLTLLAFANKSIWLASISSAQSRHPRCKTLLTYLVLTYWAYFTRALHRTFNNGRNKDWISICDNVQSTFIHRSLPNMEVQEKEVADSLPLRDLSLRLRFIKLPSKHVNQLPLYMNTAFFFHFPQLASKGTMIFDDFFLFQMFWNWIMAILTTFDYLRKCSTSYDGNVRQATMVMFDKSRYNSSNGF